MFLLSLLLGLLLYPLGELDQEITIRDVQNTDVTNKVELREDQNQIVWKQPAQDTLKITINPIAFNHLTSYGQDTFEFYLTSQKKNDGEIQIIFVDSNKNKVLSSQITTNFEGLRRFTMSCRYDMQRYKSQKDVDQIYLVAQNVNSLLTVHLPLRHKSRYHKRIKNGHLAHVKGFFSDTTYHHFYAKEVPEVQTRPTPEVLRQLELTESAYLDFLADYQPGQNCSGKYLHEEELKDVNGNRTLLHELLGSEELINVTPEKAGVPLLSLVQHWLQNRNAEDLALINQIMEEVYTKGFAENSEIIYNQYYLREYFLATLLIYPHCTANNQESLDRTIDWYLKVHKIFDKKYVPESYFSDLIRNEYLFLLGRIFHVDPLKRPLYLKALSAHLDRVFSNESIKSGWLKPDGTSFHHNSHYIAYMYSFNEMVHLIDFLERSGFPLSDQSLIAFRDAVTAILVVSNRGRYTNNVSGRHPFKTENPVCESSVLRLSEILKERKLTAKILPEDLLYDRYTKTAGFWQFNYGNIGAYRTNGYLMVAKGFSKNFWGSEIYARENRFGKYQGYGTLEIIDSTGFYGSGFREYGWDWNRPPGSTTINLPDQKLNPPQMRVDEYTNKNFAGALSIGQIEDGTQLSRGAHGIFAIDFQERKNAANHDASFGFRKSYHFYNGETLCLGSGITKNESPYKVTTNILQAPTNKTERVRFNGADFEPMTDWKLNSESDLPMVVARGKLYYCVYRAKNLELNQQIQRGRNKTNTRTHSGAFTNLFIDHGTAPENDSYEYVIATKQRNFQEKPYTILQQDEQAHIVKFADEREDYVMYQSFSTNEATPTKGSLLRSTQGILSIQNNTSEVKVSFTNPSLEFDKDGLPLAQPAQIEIHGTYKLKSASQAVTIKTEDSNTQIFFEAGHGHAVEIELSADKKDD